MTHEELETLVDSLEGCLKKANLIIDELSKNACEVEVDIRTHKHIGLPEIPNIDVRVYADLTKKRKIKEKK